LGEFEGGIFARESFPRPARSAEPSRKIASSFFDFARADFFLKERQFFCEAGRRFAAAGGGSA